MSDILYSYIAINLLLAIILPGEIFHKQSPTYAALQKNKSILLKENTQPTPFL